MRKGNKQWKEENIKRKHYKKGEEHAVLICKNTNSIRELLNCDEPLWASLQLACNNLDKIKNEINDTHYEFYEYIDSEEERQTAYQWFDVQDRVAIELRTQLIDKIYSVERKAEEQKPKSIFSGNSKRSKKSNTLGGSARS